MREVKILFIDKDLSNFKVLQVILDLMVQPIHEFRVKCFFSNDFEVKEEEIDLVVVGMGHLEDHPQGFNDLKKSVGVDKIIGCSCFLSNRERAQALGIGFVSRAKDLEETVMEIIALIQKLQP